MDSQITFRQTIGFATLLLIVMVVIQGFSAYRVGSMSADIGGIRSDVKGLKEGLAGIKTDADANAKASEDKIDVIKTSADKIIGDVSALKQEFTALKKAPAPRRIEGVWAFYIQEKFERKLSIVPKAPKNPTPADLKDETAAVEASNNKYLFRELIAFRTDALLAVTQRADSLFRIQQTDFNAANKLLYPDYIQKMIRDHGVQSAEQNYEAMLKPRFISDDSRTIIPYALYGDTLVILDAAGAQIVYFLIIEGAPDAPVTQLSGTDPAGHRNVKARRVTFSK